MSIRAVMLGLLLGAAISLATYFNDFVIRQSSLINHLLPLSVLGTTLLLLLAVNPLLRLRSPRWPLRSGEIGVIVALGLCACTWPGAGFYRTAVSNMTLPARDVFNHTAWRSAQVMAYLPGGSGELTVAQVEQWPAFVEALRAAGAAGAASHPSPANPPGTDADAVVHELAARLGAAGRRLLGSTGALSHADRAALVREINAAMKAAPLDARASPSDAGTSSAPAATHAAAPAAGPDAEPRLAAARLVRRNHRLLAERLPGIIAPMPSGMTLLPDGGQLTGAVHALNQGRQPRYHTILDLPWQRWWPTAGFWSGLVLLVGLASLCLAVIVHPLWSQRELLAYPIPRFVTEVTRREPGDWIPRIAHHKGFWVAAIALFSLHLLNGLHAWFPALPYVALRYNFTALESLCPTLRHIGSAHAYFWPVIFPSIIAFSFFLQGSVSLSLGLAPAAYVLLAAALWQWGAPLRPAYLGTSNDSMMHFGAYLGFAAVMLFTGRAYYLNVARAALGGRRREVTGAGVWAARALAATFALAVLLLHQAGLAWALAAAFVLLVLLIFLVIARITAETGMFMIQPYWMPVGILTGLLGFQAIGPTAYIVLALASTMVAGDTRTVLLANLVNALKIADDTGGTRPGRLSPWLIVMILAGFILAGIATFTVILGHGVLHTDGFTANVLPALPFDTLAKQITDTAAWGRLGHAVNAEGAARLGLIHLDPSLYLWLAIGAAIVLGMSLARLRLAWWPLHPVMFLVWGTFPGNRFAASFLLGWMLKAALVRVGGARAYQSMIPAVVGAITGALLGGVFWIVVGAVYYAATGVAPTSYSIF